MDLFDDLPEPSAIPIVTSDVSTKIDKEDSSSISSNTVNNINNSISTSTDTVSLKRAHSSDTESAAVVQDNTSSFTEEGGNHGGKRPHLELFPVVSISCARKGERDEMQDAHVVLDDFVDFCNKVIPSGDTTGNDLEGHRLAFYAIYDGHAGTRASRFAAEHLHTKLAQRIPRGGNWTQFDRDVKRIFFDVYKSVDGDFLRLAVQARPHWKDGSTASTVLLVDNTLYVANVGDSKVVLGRETVGVSGVLTPLCLTVDHNPQDYEERQRIQKTGSVVRDGRVSGILEVSRSLGDYQFKKQGVTSLPDVRKCVLTERDRFLVIACDGLWKSFTPDEVVALCLNMVPLDTKSEELRSKLEEAGTKLANDAVLRLSGDNVSVILVALNFR